MTELMSSLPPYQGRRKVTTLEIALVVTVFSLGSFLLILVWRTPDTQYYAVAPAGHKRLIHTLPVPSLSHKPLARWAAAAVISSFNLNFNDLDSQLEGLKRFFTDAGYENFLATMSHVLSAIREQRQVVSAVVQGLPYIADVETNAGNEELAWGSVVFLSTRTEVAGKSTTRDYRVEVEIERTSTRQSKEGIAIRKYKILQEAVI